MLLIPEVLLDYGLNFRKSFSLLFNSFQVKNCDEAIASAILNFSPILTLLVLLFATCNAASAAAPPFFHFHCNAY
ncbi:hypothetical protein T08_1135 [Trichinella sp. T8]|nr:hypothetical protein T08_1135 [Trichinella sp. T8]